MGIEHLDVWAHARQRWAARAALGCAALAVLLPLGYAREASLLLVVGVVVGVGLTVASLWWVLIHRGVVRIAAGALAVAAPVGVIWWFAAVNLLWVVIVSAALWAVAVWSGKFALSSTKSHQVHVPEPPPPSPLKKSTPPHT
ncbi:diacylglycerol kinase, partial [Streptomyces europaeiscabiei]|nr:diacylglycerol kinase [Streptomyces europaeiscabiei]